MRTSFFLAFLFLSQVAFAQREIRLEVISQAQLFGKGIKVRKVDETSTLPMCRIDVDISMKEGTGTYRLCELVVLDCPVYPETLRGIEYHLKEKAVRTETTEETQKSFTLFGKEEKRAYIAVMVLRETGDFDRYLLPASEMKNEKDEANQPPLQTPTSGTPAASASAKATADRGVPVAPPPGIAGR
jgi:hypothetical protein